MRARYILSTLGGLLAAGMLGYWLSRPSKSGELESILQEEPAFIQEAKLEKPSAPITTLPFVEPKEVAEPPAPPQPEPQPSAPINDSDIPDLCVRVIHQNQPLEAAVIHAVNQQQTKYTKQVWDPRREGHLLVDVPYGEYKLWVVFNGKMQDHTFLYKSQNVIFQPGTLETQVVMDDPKQVKVRVVEGSGKQVPARVQVLNYNAWFIEEAKRTFVFRTDANVPSHFALNEGSYNFHVVADDPNLPEKEETFEKLQDEFLFELLALPPVHGVVLGGLAKVPVQGANVFVTSGQGNNLLSTPLFAVTDEQGAFTLTRLPANDRRISGSEWPPKPRIKAQLNVCVEHPEYCVYFDRDQEVTDNQLATIVLDAGATVEVQVMNNGQLLDGFPITMKPYMLFGRSQMTRSEPHGSTIYTNKPPFFIDKLMRQGTTEQGRVVFRGVMPAGYVIPIDMPGEEAPLNVFYQTAVITQDTTITVDIPLIVNLEGRVLDVQKDKNIPGVIINFTRDRRVSPFTAFKAQSTDAGYATRIFSGKYQVKLGNLQNMFAEESGIEVNRLARQVIDLPIDLPVAWRIQLVDAETGSIIPETPMGYTYANTRDQRHGAQFTGKTEDGLYIIRIPRDTRLVGVSFNPPGYERMNLKESDISQRMQQEPTKIEVKRVR